MGSTISPLSLSGLIVLADLAYLARHSILSRPRVHAWPQTLLLCPGIHHQQNAPALAGGEYPACAAMTTGYVFRVENEATVYLLQRVGGAGCLTTLRVEQAGPEVRDWWTEPETLAQQLTPFALAFMGSSADWWAMTAVAGLVVARLINVTIMGRRATRGWHGAKEPGARGDLLVLLSQDRWIRLQGLVDDLKAVASGQWLREMTFGEEMAELAATVLVYLAVALMASAKLAGQIMFLVLMVGSTTMLAWSTASTRELHLNGLVVRQEGMPKQYHRRLDMAEELIKESGRKDWAVKLGMVNSDYGRDGGEQEVTM